jgi:hypothetical protein
MYLDYILPEQVNIMREIRNTLDGEEHMRYLVRWSLDLLRAAGKEVAYELDFYRFTHVDT